MLHRLSAAWLGPKGLGAWLGPLLILLVGTSGLLAQSRMPDSKKAQDGSLLFLQNGSSIVQTWTHSEITHVAMVFRESSGEMVYEATPTKVRRVSLKAYYREIGMLNAGRGNKPLRLWMVNPRHAYESDEIKAMRDFLLKQVGRRYSVKGIVAGKMGDGVHCSELMAHTLSEGGKICFLKPHLVSPGKMMESVVHTYTPARELNIPIIPNSSPWYNRVGTCMYDCAVWSAWCMQDVFTWCW